jgi:hypothetical protein
MVAQMTCSSQQPSLSSTPFSKMKGQKEDSRGLPKSLPLNQGSNSTTYCWLLDLDSRQRRVKRGQQPGLQKDVSLALCGICNSGPSSGFWSCPFPCVFQVLLYQSKSAISYSLAEPRKTRSFFVLCLAWAIVPGWHKRRALIFMWTTVPWHSSFLCIHRCCFFSFGYPKKVCLSLHIFED